MFGNGYLKCFSSSSTSKKEIKPNSFFVTTMTSDRSDSDFSTASSVRSFAISSSVRRSNLREFTFSELKAATKNFSRSLMLGEGGFGGVYRGAIKSSEDSHKKMDIAVKQLSRRGLQGHKEWVTEVNVLGVVEHENLVKLVGYCAEDDERGLQRLLVYEYLPNRSVQDHLSTKSRLVLPWPTRVKIAQHTASGLAYLHQGMDFQLIGSNERRLIKHIGQNEALENVDFSKTMDFKSSNILLDVEWNAKLSDFGLARLGPSDGLSHVSTAIVGTIGYAAPEYLQTGRLTSKIDVWSYGVFLYELITGRRPLDRNKPKNEQNLIEWARPHVSNSKKFELILDPRLEGNYCLKSAHYLAYVANRCLVRKAVSRPNMSEVLEMVNRVVQVSEEPRVPHPLMSLVSEDKSSKSTREWLKKRLKNPLFGDNSCLIWLRPTPTP